MRSFWSYLSGGRYAVGCTGRTVCVCDAAGREVATFRDLPYAYLPALSPDGETLAVKSTEGRLAAYSLRELRLIKKFRFSPADVPQDDNMCFSPDGKLLYNIESLGRGETRIAAYSSDSFAAVLRLFEGEGINARCLECTGGQVFVLGDRESGQGEERSSFTALLQGGHLEQIRPASERDADLCLGYVALRDTGFTKTAKQWASLRYMGYDMENIEGRDLSIGRLWREGGFR